MKSTKLLALVTVSLYIIAFSASATAQSDVWHELLQVMRFGDVNRARLEFDCRSNPQFSSMAHLISLCKRQELISNQVIEQAALPFMKKHLSERLAKQGIAQLSSKSARTITDKLIIEIASGKQDQLTQNELILLKQQNESEVGRALSAFATDREQGLAVGRAILEYQRHEP